MYGFRSKLVCLSKPMKSTDFREDASLLQELSIVCKLRIRNVLYDKPLVNVLHCLAIGSNTFIRL
jgi:hypothetical protein